MRAAVAEKPAEERDAIDLSRASVQSSVPTVLSSEVPFARAAFATRTAIPVEHSQEIREQNPFEVIFRDGDRLQKMWLSLYGSHITVIGNENNQGVTIKVIDMRAGTREIVSQLHIGENPVSFSVSPDGTGFLLALPDSVAEYNIGKNGQVRTGFVYQADDGRSITGARYEGDSVKISFASPVKAALQRAFEKDGRTRSLLTAV